MKYLKTYKIFESSNISKNDKLIVGDLFLYLRDKYDMIEFIPNEFSGIEDLPKDEYYYEIIYFTIPTNRIFMNIMIPDDKFFDNEIKNDMNEFSELLSNHGYNAYVRYVDDIIGIDIR